MLKPWIEAQPRLVEIAAGRAHADLVIRGGAWVNVHTREVIEDTLLLALIRAGQTAKAHDLLERRLHRRPSPRDAAWLAAL